MNEDGEGIVGAKGPARSAAKQLRVGSFPGTNAEPRGMAPHGGYFGYAFGHCAEDHGRMHDGFGRCKRNYPSDHIKHGCRLIVGGFREISRWNRERGSPKPKALFSSQAATASAGRFASGTSSSRPDFTS